MSKENDWQPRTQHPRKIPFINEGEIKMFPVKKEKEYFPRKDEEKEIQKCVIWLEWKWSWVKPRTYGKNEEHGKWYLWLNEEEFPLFKTTIIMCCRVYNTSTINRCQDI